MGKSKLILGDCYERLKEIPDGSVNLVLTDPPFGVTRNEWDKEIDLPTLWTEMERIIAPNATVMIFAMGRFLGRVICSNEKRFAYNLVWVYGHGSDFMSANRKPLTRHQEICVFRWPGAVYNRTANVWAKPYRQKRLPIKSACYGEFGLAVSESKDGARCPTTVLEYTRESHAHPTQKPVPLLEWMIKSYSNPGDTVLDPFMGSGSTGVAAVRTGRAFIGIELNPGYYRIAEERIADEQK